MITVLTYLKPVIWQVGKMQSKKEEAGTQAEVGLVWEGRNRTL